MIDNVEFIAPIINMFYLLLHMLVAVIIIIRNIHKQFVILGYIVACGLFGFLSMLTITMPLHVQVGMSIGICISASIITILQLKEVLK